MVNRRKKIGIVSTGQTPRVDIVPEMRKLWGPDIEVIQAGALDGIGLEEVQQKYAPEKSRDVICTRMGDGSEVVVCKDLLVPGLQRSINLLSKKGADVLLLVCTGRFPRFTSSKPLIKAQEVFDHMVTALHQEGKKIALIVPVERQIEPMKKRFKHLKGELVGYAYSPYESEEDLVSTAKKLKKENVYFTVMHCMGYTMRMQKKLVEITGRPALLARSVVARAVKEFMV
jgi:protein AroM